MWKHFKIEEFNCKCCGENYMSELFLDRLDEARDLAKVPFVITSGYRCPKHNRAVGSTSDNHTKGVAADIACDRGPMRLLIVSALLNAGFRRLGIGKRFIHVDANGSRTDSIWLY